MQCEAMCLFVVVETRTRLMYSLLHWLTIPVSHLRDANMCDKLYVVNARNGGRATAPVAAAASYTDAESVS